MRVPRPLHPAETAMSDRPGRDTPDFSLTNRERAMYGCTVTAINLDNRQLHTIARTGMTSVKALEQIIDELEQLDGTWRIRTVSMPNTIERDLFAHRYPIAGRFGVGQLEPTALPEHALLTKIGRTDLIHRDPPRTRIYDGPTAWQR